GSSRSRCAGPSRFGWAGWRPACSGACSSPRHRWACSRCGCSRAAAGRRRGSEPRPGADDLRRVPARSPPGTMRPSRGTTGETRMSHLVDIFVQPGKAWAELKEQPTFWLPLLLIAVSSALMVLVYYLQVDPEWAVD